MRIAYWAIATAAVATAAYLAKRQAKKNAISRFLAALAAKRVTVFAEHPGIAMAGVREHWFSGAAEDIPFHFNARTDKHGTSWAFTLTWKDGAIVERWHALKHARPGTLAEVHDLLRRLPAHREGSD